jgi:fatty acid desaturase
MKIFAYVALCAVGLAGIYFHVDYSGWVLLIGCLGVLNT